MATTGSGQELYILYEYDEYEDSDSLSFQVVRGVYTDRAHADEIAKSLRSEAFVEEKEAFLQRGHGDMRASEIAEWVAEKRFTVQSITVDTLIERKA